MRRFLAIGMAAALVTAASAALLHDNGPFITGVGDGFGGASTSAIEAGFTSFGFNCDEAEPAANGGPFRVADDFTITDPAWDLTNVKFYAYQTGSTLTSTFTAAYVTIYSWDGTNLNPVAGDYTTNRLLSSAFSGVYRVTATTLTNNQRPIMELDIDLSWAPYLPAGTYYIGISTNGSLATGPWAVPKTPSAPTDNGIQYVGNPTAPATPGWYLIDGNGTAAGGNQDLPIKLYGTVVPEPAAALLLVAGLLAARRR